MEEIMRITANQIGSMFSMLEGDREELRRNPAEIYYKIFDLKVSNLQQISLEKLQ